MAGKHKSNSDKLARKPLVAAPQSAAPVKGYIALLDNPAVQLLVIAILGIIAYANTFHAPFVFDDQSSIIDNQIIKDFSTFLSGAGYAYHPRRFVAYLSFALNYKFGGLDTTGYHMVNLAIHIINAWLVYSLVRLTFKTPFFSDREQGFTTQNSKLKTQNFLPFLAALLFVVHPVQTQAVTYIVQRLASLAAMFYLLSVLLYIKARLCQEETGKLFSPGAVVFYLISLVSAILAMRTKEIAATLPVLVLLYEFSFFGTSTRKKLLFLVPLLLTLLIVPIGMLHSGNSLGELLSDLSEMTRESREISRGGYLLTQFAVIVTYIRLLFLPVNQNLDYDYPIYDSLFTPRVFLSFLLLCSILGLAVWLYYRSYECKMKNEKCKVQNENQKTDFSFFIFHFSFFIPKAGAMRLVAFGILWFFLTLSVESSIIPIADVIFEHRLYLPAVGFFLAVAAGVALLAERLSPRAVAAGAMAVILALAGATYARNAVWIDDVSIWRDTAEKSPSKPRPHYNLGKALLKRNLVDEAIIETQAAVRLAPTNPEARNNLGAALERKGLLDQAITEYRVAVEHSSTFSTARENLGAALEKKGMLAEAVEQYRNALERKPDSMNAHNNLGGALLKLGRTAEAMEHLQTAIRLRPDALEPRSNLGAAYEQLGDLNRAMAEYREALKIDPMYPNALLNLGIALYREGRIDEAVRHYETALQAKPDFVKAHVCLAKALLKKGEMDRAIGHLEESARLEPSNPEPRNLLAGIAELRRMEMAGRR